MMGVEVRKVPFLIGMLLFVVGDGKPPYLVRSNYLLYALPPRFITRLYSFFLQKRRAR